MLRTTTILPRKTPIVKWLVFISEKISARLTANTRKEVGAPWGGFSSDMAGCEPAGREAPSSGSQDGKWQGTSALAEASSGIGQGVVVVE